MRKLATLICFLSANWAFGQDIAVNLIPQELLQGANAVVRYDDFTFEIKSKAEVVSNRTWAITIFNEKGENDHAIFKAYYDKLSKIRDIECAIHDASGKEIKRLRRGDIKDIGRGYASDDVVDSRIKIASFDDKKYEYPYTVVFHYEEESKNPMFYPAWYPIRDENTSVQKAKFTVLNPNKIPFRYKETCYNSKIESEVLLSNGDKVWSASNLKAFEHEPFSNDDGQIGILLAPVEFELDGVFGDLKTWESASKFYYKFNDQRQKLPAETLAKVIALTKGIQDPVLKTQKVYEFMQSHTRYMSIQLGVGGWQTIPAEKVAANGYGDCKALTNYTVALLHAVGIDRACPALIKAGKYDRFSYHDLPRMSSFNHVIACVPIGNDTLWLECTSQSNPFGYLGSFTGNRKALLIKPNGGSLVNTKSYAPENNLQKRITEVHLAADGSAELSVNGTYTGLQQEERNAITEQKTLEDQRVWLLQQINIPNFELKSFSFQSEKETVPTMTEDMEIFARKLASLSGKRLFLKLNPLSAFFNAPSNTERKTDIYLNENTFSVLDQDSIIFHLPQKIEIEYLPKDLSFQSEFGTYQVEYKRNADILTVSRKVMMKGGTYPAEKYTELYEFLKNVNRADGAKVVLVLGET